MGSYINVAEIHTDKIGRIDAAIYPRNKSGSNMEVDNHADTTVLGIYCLPVHDFRIPVDVSG